jgi:predicted secreted hydrolase
MNDMNKRWLGFGLLTVLLGTVWLIPDQPVQQNSASSYQISDLLSAENKDFAKVLTPRPFIFPQDHGPHPAYRSEWWYFTGNLHGVDNRRFGYELTFFRFALTPQVIDSASSWHSNQIYMAHFALTDAANNHFYADERFARAGNDLAGAKSDKLHVWLYNWQAQARDDSTMAEIQLTAQTETSGITLTLLPLKGPVKQARDGLSQKSAEPGNASYYYSYTRLQTSGEIRIGKQTFSVTGNSWMDREWSSSALSTEQAGWDWFSLQLSDNSEVMFYQMRRKDGKVDPHSAGAVFDSNKKQYDLHAEDVEIIPMNYWQSPHSGITYPAKWRLIIPKQGLDLLITPVIADQELNVTYRYWEGAVDISGDRNGKPINGQGYVELAGYQ